MNKTVKFTPVFSCAGVSDAVQTAYQNRWFLVDENGQVLEDTTDKTAALSLSIRFAYLVFKAPGMLRLDIPIEVLEDDEDAFEPITLNGHLKRAVNEGELATAWFSNYYGKTVHLMKLHPEDHQA
ncbi:hypothetical protein JHL22_10660 [Advenella sp. WQ 585]|uniref:MOSC N-terminal beta barrel domain-containing protein n=1 Tax=Advenella mandrilli TaxID=2800330 RepID=A0ABS1EFS0_9BURK|nr:hypothetical protein [Advenella mandrilli]MBK1781680.1 hypothetical protein [Advenella mandrilli]